MKTALLCFAGVVLCRMQRERSNTTKSRSLACMTAAQACTTSFRSSLSCHGPTPALRQSTPTPTMSASRSVRTRPPRGASASAFAKTTSASRPTTAAPTPRPGTTKPNFATIPKIQSRSRSQNPKPHKPACLCSPAPADTSDAVAVASSSHSVVSGAQGCGVPGGRRYRQWIQSRHSQRALSGTMAEVLTRKLPSTKASMGPALPPSCTSCPMGEMFCRRWYQLLRRCGGSSPSHPLASGSPWPDCRGRPGCYRGA